MIRSIAFHPKALNEVMKPAGLLTCFYYNAFPIL